MNPISPFAKGHVPASAAATVIRVVTPAERASHAVEVNTDAVASPAAPMSWKNRGEYHLSRKELELAVDAFTKALQEAEEQRSPELIVDSPEIFMSLLSTSSANDCRDSLGLKR